MSFNHRCRAHLHAGGYCLTGSKDRSVRLWNPAKGLQINTYKGNGGDVRGLAVSHDNRTFLSCGTDRLVNFFDVATGSVIRRFSGHDAAVNAVSFAAEESLAVSTSYDATVRFWDMKSRNTRPIDVVKVATDSVTGLAVPSSVPLVVTSAVDGIITTLDIRKGELVKDDMHVPVSTISVPEDALYIVAACTDDTVRLLDRKKGSVIGSYTGHRHKDFQVECGLICHDSVAVCGSEDGTRLLSLQILTSDPRPDALLPGYSLCDAATLLTLFVGLWPPSFGSVASILFCAIIRAGAVLSAGEAAA